MAGNGLNKNMSCLKLLIHDGKFFAIINRHAGWMNPCLRTTNQFLALLVVGRAQRTNLIAPFWLYMRVKTNGRSMLILSMECSHQLGICDFCATGKIGFSSDIQVCPQWLSFNRNLALAMSSKIAAIYI